MKYTKPKFELIQLSTIDVITVSNSTEEESKISIVQINESAAQALASALDLLGLG